MPETPQPNRSNPANRPALGGAQVAGRNVRNVAVGSAGFAAIVSAVGYLFGWTGETIMQASIASTALVGVLVPYVFAPLGTWARNEQARRKGEGIPVTPGIAILASWALLATFGCVHYDGAGYLAQQRAALASYQTAETILPEHCAQHDAGADALRDREGASWAMRGPLGKAESIESLAADHSLLADGCEQAVDRLALPTPLVARTFDAWTRVWLAGAERVDAADAPLPIPPAPPTAGMGTDPPVWLCPSGSTRLYAEGGE